MTAAVSGDKVEGDLAQKGEVTGGGAVAYPAVVLAEGDVEDPVQGVLDAPVPADGPDQDGGIVAAAGQGLRMKPRMFSSHVGCDRTKRNEPRSLLL